ncbi:hypothetical protein [Streptomyces daliensis]|uniref:Uncharacterized protein n=1 Tax=Streptomyces daliensis TaxID=299421 RepID=A0A8T4IXD5_9ACTN|nr:hypothetical protein [Streptomyces daliensis]
MPDDSFYTQDQISRMHQLEQLKSDNYDRGSQHYEANLDSQTARLGSDAYSAHSYFNATGRKLDENWEAYANMQQRMQQGHRVSRSEQERTERRWAIASSSHVESVEPFLQLGINYQQRLKQIMDRADATGQNPMAQMAMATQPSHSHGGGSRAHESSRSHGHSSSSSHRHHTSHHSSHHAGAGSSRGR